MPLLPDDVLPDGRVRTDLAALAAAAEDFGHLTHSQPRAVVEPRSVEDLLALTRWAGRHGVPLRLRGTGHSLRARVETTGEIVLAMTELAAVHAVEGDTVIVDGGASWNEVLFATTPHGLSPPVLTDYLETTVAGTLSVGGIGGTSHRYGAQTDNVVELEVVTGEGELVTCSPEQHPELFHAVLGGMGRCGVIVRAKLRLVEIAPRVRRYRLYYDRLHPFTAAQRLLMTQPRFDYVEGAAAPVADGEVLYTLQAAAFTTDASSLDDAALLDGLHQQGVEVEDLDYFRFANRMLPGVAARREAGDWATAHPWLNAFLPDSAADTLLSNIFAELTPEEMGEFGLALTYPIRTEPVSAGLLRLPDEPVAFLLGLLLSASSPQEASTMQERNSRMYQEIRAHGGTLYPFGPPPLEPSEWRQHYGPQWSEMHAAKCRYDPHGIFASPAGLRCDGTN